MSFQWNPAKARANRAEHGIILADAVAVFEDPRAITLDDPHPAENRHVTIRLISARKATRAELTEYQEE